MTGVESSTPVTAAATSDSADISTTTPAAATSRSADISTTTPAVVLSGSMDISAPEPEEMAGLASSPVTAAATSSSADINTTTSGPAEPTQSPNDQLVSGPGLSMTGLESALPTDTSEWQTVGGKKSQQQGRQQGQKKPGYTGPFFQEEIKDLRSRLEEETKKMKMKAKRPRPQSFSEEQPVFKRVSQAPPAVAMGVDEQKAPPNYRQRCGPKQYIRAAIRVGNLEVLGNPFADVKGYRVKVKFDGGRYNEASISLGFRINKGSLDEPLSKDPTKIWQFTCQFRFNVVVGEGTDNPTSSILHFRHRHIDPRKISSEDRKAIPEEIPDNVTQSKKNNWTTFLFTANKIWIEREAPNEQQIQDIVKRKPILGSTLAVMRVVPQMFQIWFCWQPEDVAEEQCFKYLRYSYERMDRLIK